MTGFHSAGTGHAKGVPSGRAAALDLLRSVLDRRVALDDALAEPALDRLEPRERAFARLLAATVLRRMGQIDAVIAACMDRPLSGRGLGAQHLLRLGTAQLLFLGTPAHAAVAATVELAAGRLAPWRGLANAVLRRIAREGANLMPGALVNLPAWMLESWAAAYGRATAEAIALATLDDPPLDIRVKGDPAPWAERLEARVLPTGTLRRAVANPALLPGYGDGAWWVQDAAAALPVLLLGDVAGKTVIDLCAAPGGKTAQLAAAGAHVTAVDRSPPRLARLAANLKRLGLSAQVVAADAARWRPQAPADRVLLDAPCSATGTLRRHPDLKHLKGPGDVARQTAMQDRLLRAAIEIVRPGGMIVYAVCSLEAAEGPERIAALLGGGAAVDLVPVTAGEIGGLEACIDGPYLRTLPCHLAAEGGLDGFFAARLKRR